MHPRLLLEAALVLAALLAGLLARIRPADGGARAGLCLERLALQPRLAVAAAFLASLLAAPLLSGGRGPAPRINDEFAYLLGADTFASGRLANPTHPMWPHFDTFYVLQQPTYQAKYPPGQALALAAGQTLAGHPLAGVRLSFALAAAALAWMLLAWVPAPWALLGALLPALRFGVLRATDHHLFAYWSQSYWGGAVATIGGALLLGAAPRLAARRRAGDAAVLALGLLVLAASRPLEGAVLGLPVTGWLAVRLLAPGRPPLARTLARVALPAALVLGAGAAALAVYNRAVTGDFRLSPYDLHMALYEPVPNFTWMRPRPAPSYRHEELRRVFVDWRHQVYRDCRSLPGLARKAASSLARDWLFFLGPALSVPLVAVLLPGRERRLRAPLLAAAVIPLVHVAVVVETFHAHYYAPAVPLLLLLVVAGLRRLQGVCWCGRAWGRPVAHAILVVCVISFLTAAVARWRPTAGPASWNQRRAGMLARLERDGGRHLVVVHYRPDHPPGQEWVHNRADIDAAAVVWARSMGAEEDARLVDYFADRTVWRLDADEEPPRLVPWEGAPSGPAGSR